jgi:hypothetical protein
MQDNSLASCMERPYEEPVNAYNVWTDPHGLTEMRSMISSRT